MALQRNLCVLFRRRGLRAWAYASILLISGGVISASAQTPPPVLISQPSSTRAIALESLNFVSEPFKLESPYSFGDDHRTRIMLFALNLSLAPGEALSSVNADAEDASHRHYNLLVEHVGPVPEQEWLTAVVVRLSDDMGDVGDVLVRVTHDGVASNRVRVAIGHLGGGPADDQGAAPTPAPPYLIAGQVTFAGEALAGVSVKLNGPQAETVVTDAGGGYRFTVQAAGGSYSVTPLHSFFDFSASPTFLNLSGNQINVNFTALRRSFAVRGKVLDDLGQGINGVQVTLWNESDEIVAAVLTAGGGSYSFPNLPAGFAYTLTAEASSFFNFNPRNTTALSGNLTIDLNGSRRSYAIGGIVTNAAGSATSGVTINLSGRQSATVVSDDSGAYLFSAVPAGGNYTLTPVATPFYAFTPKTINELSSNQTANFNGALRKYSIAGRMTNGTEGLRSVEMRLSGARSAATVTDSNGDFLFADLPAAANYTLTPVATPFYVFTVQNVNNLGSNQTLTFNGALRKYSFSGRITEGVNGISGVNIALTGSEQAVTTTDSNGNFTFANVTAGGTYTLTPTRTQYVFSPPSLFFEGLAGDKPADFSSSFRYYVAGTVADNTGRGLAGLTMTVSGSQSATTLTALDGSYSFALAPTGNYTVTPSIEQGWYLFGPTSQNFNSLTGNQTLNFTASLAPLPNPAQVLEFDGSPKAVDYGYIWQPDVDLGHFFWEFWAMPGSYAGATYMLSDGYGGAHALLFGFANLNTSERGRYQFIGNIYNGVTYDNYFRSDEGPAPGEWGHFAVGWDGKKIITYLNGVPVGRTAFTGPRRTPGIGGGGGRLLIGGSDHSNFEGRIAQVRGYEGRNPREDPIGLDQTLVESAFDPQNVFAPDGNLTSYFLRPAPRVADLSGGLNGITHPGVLRGTINGILYGCSGCPLPTFVIDPTAPNFATGTPAAPVAVSSPAPVPAGARIFDSFSRTNSTYIFGGKGGLGATEGGTAGAKLWQTSVVSQQKPFGILNGRAVVLGNSTYISWIPTGSTSANLDIRVDRHPGLAGSGHDTGLCFRVVGGGNFFFAYSSPGSTPTGPRSLTVGYYLNGRRVILASGVTMPAIWTTLQVVTRSSGEITVYAGGIQVYTTSSNIFPTVTGAGLYNNSAGQGLVNRWDNFTVYDAP
ncbi:MAG: carboxypeptidase regulatory-like domain-containing protein [Pyrinomonadaceae bacterium]